MKEIIGYIIVYTVTFCALNKIVNKKEKNKNFI